MSILRGIARPLLVAPLALDAVDALIHPDQHAAKLEGLRPLFNKVEDSTQIDDIDPYLRSAARISAGVALAASVTFSLGKAPRTSAALLAGIALPMAIINHEDRTSLGLKLANCAGLVFAGMDRRGRPSAAWRRDEKRSALSQQAIAAGSGQ